MIYSRILDFLFPLPVSYPSFAYLLLNDKKLWKTINNDEKQQDSNQISHQQEVLCSFKFRSNESQVVDTFLSFRRGLDILH